MAGRFHTTKVRYFSESIFVDAGLDPGMLVNREVLIGEEKQF